MLPNDMTWPSGAVLSYQMEIYGVFTYFVLQSKVVNNTSALAMAPWLKDTSRSENDSPFKVKADTMCHSQACTVITGG